VKATGNGILLSAVVFLAMCQTRIIRNVSTIQTSNGMTANVLAKTIFLNVWLETPEIPKPASAQSSIAIQIRKGVMHQMDGSGMEIRIVFANVKHGEFRARMEVREILKLVNVHRLFATQHLTHAIGTFRLGFHIRTALVDVELI
jgi:hypothetical protein